MREMTCYGKTAHNTFEQAHKRLKKQNIYRTGQHSKLAREKIDIYKCPYCFKWHVGKTANTTHVERRANPYNRAKQKMRYN